MSGMRTVCGERGHTIWHLPEIETDQQSVSASAKEDVSEGGIQAEEQCKSRWWKGCEY